MILEFFGTRLVLKATEAYLLEAGVDESQIRPDLQSVPTDLGSWQTSFCDSQKNVQKKEDLYITLI